MTTQTNEAAEWLNKWAPSSKADPEGYLLWLQTKQAALAAERRATVERIIGLLHAAGYDDFDTLLEEVAE